MRNPTPVPLLPLFTAAVVLAGHTMPRQVADPAGCSSVRVFIARGTDEPYPGRQGALADAICAKSEDPNSCAYEDIVYPAGFDTYCDSAYAGVTGGTQQITDYVAECPESKVVLTGYSQGGHVVGDILGGGGGNIMGCEQPVNEGLSPDTAPGNSVKAAVFFGDVRYVANQTYNAGNGTTRNGIWPRTGEQLKSLHEFSDVLQSWCIEGDSVCYSGGNSTTAHTSYFQVYLEEASEWVVSQL